MRQVHYNKQAQMADLQDIRNNYAAQTVANLALQFAVFEFFMDGCEQRRRQIDPEPLQLVLTKAMSRLVRDGVLKGKKHKRKRGAILVSERDRAFTE